MSAATDRMADEAMVRIQAQISRQADKARAALHFRYAVMLEESQRRTNPMAPLRAAFLLLQASSARAAQAYARAMLALARFDKYEEFDSSFTTPDGKWQVEISGSAFRRTADLNEPDALPLPTLFLGGLAVVLVLGVLGPQLDAQPDRRAEWLQTERALHVEGTLQSWEEEARTRCAKITGANGAYILVDGGAVVCTDKRGRRVGRPL